MAYKFQLGAARLGGAITADGVLSASSAELDTALAIAEGGTGANNASSARSNLGLGSAAEQAVGVGNGNVLQADNGIVDDDFLKVNGSVIEGRSASEVLSDIGAQASLTFGIANGNAMKFASDANAVDDDFLRIKGTDIEGRSAAEVLVDIGAQAASSVLTELATMASTTADALADLGTSEVQLLDGAVATNNAGAVKAAILDASNNLTIAGDLIVNGTTTTVNSTELTVADTNIVLRQGGSGNADGIGITFGSSDSQTLQTRDAGSTPKLGSSLPLSASAYYGDGSNLSGVTATSAESLRLVGAGVVINSNATATNDVTLVDTTSAAITVTMPDITSATVGRVYIIKDIVGNAGSAGRAISIMKSTSNHTIDDAGNNAVMIESNFGAVNLLACSASGGGFFYSIF